MPTLDPKTSVLGYDNAYHLLRRTTYKISKARITEFSTKTPQQAVALLFSFSNPVPPSPLNNSNETIVPTFANPTITDTLSTATSVNYDLLWWMYSAYKDNSAQHKIAYFLHLMFVSDSGASFFTDFDYKEQLRYHANGSIKELALRMTTDPRMSVFLNNNLNKKNSPNQNYAREFLELFTILKGPQIATGDYTNYTELDVQQAARVFTGFTLTTANQLNLTARLNLVDPITKLPKGYVNTTNHDTGSKTFSYAFGGATITGGTTATEIETELQNFINMIFNQDETAKAYARRMYRYFAGKNISAAIETGIITPLALNLKANNYNIQTALELLWCSKHFYDEEDTIKGDQVIGSIVRNPMELYFHLFNLLELQTPLYEVNAVSIHGLMNTLFSYFSNAGMPAFNPQSVNGYSGYSSSPGYDENWITTSTLRLRYTYTVDLIINGFTKSGFLYKVDLSAFVKNSGYFSNPANADTLVTDFMTLLHLEVSTGTRYTFFRDLFLGGLSTINWTNEWNTYITSNNSNNVKIPINNLVKALVKSPEFQIL